MTSLEHATVAAIDHDEANASQIADITEPVATGNRRELFRPCRPIAQQRSTVRRRHHGIEHPVFSDFGRALVAEMLIDPVRNSPPITCSRHQGSRRMSRTHDAEMFQSSIMSWSSKIIALGTTEKNHRSISGRHAS